MEKIDRKAIGEHIKTIFDKKFEGKTTVSNTELVTEALKIIVAESLITKRRFEKQMELLIEKGILTKEEFNEKIDEYTTDDVIKHLDEIFGLD